MPSPIPHASPAHSSAHHSPVTPVSPADTLPADDLAWKSVVCAHKLTLEHAAIDIDTDRVLYHMELELETALPASALQHAQFLCLTWPYGGLWKMERVSDDFKKITCLSWRKTDLKSDDIILLAREVGELATQLETHEQLISPDDDALPGDKLPTLFDWKMMRGEWGGDVNHWFIRDVERPVIPLVVPTDRVLIAKLFVGFQPLEARIDVNAVTAIDTVAQNYSADVTWQVTLPGITALREDSALREFLDIMEIDASQFEFTNINEVHDERALLSSVMAAGDAQFKDLTLDQAHAPVTEALYHLQFRRRVVASFTEEMALHHFPFDQQKLVFDFSTGSTGMPNEMLRLTPTPVDPGSFSVENFQLGNVFEVAYHNKIFVCEIHESGPKKSMSFEMVVERRSVYYLTNVALIAAIITYLCFITWAPLPSEEDGDPEKGQRFMDTGSRLQIVTALVLTAVTFKSQVASLVPQISYFSMLDKYVFFCFIVTCLVTLENAFFTLVSEKFPKGTFSEEKFLSFSVGSFTLVNIGWALHIRQWLKRRRKTAKVLHQVHEYIRVISQVIPVKYREAVLHSYLANKKFPEWSLPKFVSTSNGDCHIQAPDDGPRYDADAKQIKKLKDFEKKKEIAMSEIPVFKEILAEIRPRMDCRVSWPFLHGSPVERRRDFVVLQAGKAFNPIRMRRRRTDATAAGTGGGDMGETRRSVSAHDYADDAVVDVTSFRSFHEKVKKKNQRVV